MLNDKDLLKVVRKVEDHVTTAAAEIAARGGSLKLLLPALSEMTRYRVTDDGELAIEFADEHGNRRISFHHGDVVPMGVGELVEEMASNEAYSSAFGHTRQGPGPASPRTPGVIDTSGMSAKEMMEAGRAGAISGRQ
jgi:hypothetical protein